MLLQRAKFPLQLDQTGIGKETSTQSDHSDVITEVGRDHMKKMGACEQQEKRKMSPALPGRDIRSLLKIKVGFVWEEKKWYPKRNVWTL